MTPYVQSRRERAGALWVRIRRNIWGYVFVTPWILLYLAFGLYPLLLSFYLTFFDYSFVNPQDLRFVGLGNWIRGLGDPLFWQSLFNIIYNQAIFITLKNLLGLATALLLFNVRFLGRLFRTIYFMPVVISVVVLMTIGTYVVSPQGPVQGLLQQSGLIQKPIFWTFDRWLPMPIIALINTWKWFGISTVIFLAGLYAIDEQLYEAAAIDGATAWQRFRYITVPQLNPQIVFILVMDVIYGLQMFTEPYSIFGVTGGPYKQGLTPVLYVYAQAFDRSNIGYASTIGLLLAVLIGVMTWLQFRFTRRDVS